MTDEMKPRPIDGGNVKQVIIEYIGPNTGTRTYRGPSRREYRFANTETKRFNWVLFDDVDRFRRFPDFRVIDESLIDPEKERREREVREAVREAFAEAQAEADVQAEAGAGDRIPKARRPGRRPGRGFGLFLFCLMECSDLRGQAGSVRGAYDAIFKYYSVNECPVGPPVPRERFTSACHYGRKDRKAQGHCTYRDHPARDLSELRARG